MPTITDPRFLALLPKPPDPPAPPAPPVLGVLVEPPKRQQRVRDWFLGIKPSVIYDDVLRRPDHYGEDQRALAAAAFRDPKELPAGVRQQDITDLVLTFFRSTELKRAVEDLRKKDEPERPGGTFEDQDFGPTIRIA